MEFKNKGTIAVVLVGLFVAFGALFAFSSSNEDETVAEESSVKAAVSIYPLQYILEEIGGEQVEITVSPTPGVDAHSFEPTARQIAELQESDLFLYNGAGVDAWAEDAVENLPETVTLIEATQSVTLLETAESEEDHSDHADEHSEEEHEDEHAHDHEEEAHGDEDEHDHAHGPNDPHVWLDPLRMVDIADEVHEALIAIDPENAELYEERFVEFKASMEELDSDYESALASCQLREIIVSHDAFEYLGSRYAITMNAIAGLSPEQEPSANRLAELTEVAEEIGAEYIFFEALTSSRTADTIAAEVGADTLVLDPIEGVSTDSSDDYETLMRANLDNLVTAMQCE